MDLCQKKSRHFSLDDETTGQGDYWMWTAVALPSRLRVTSYLSQERSEEAAQAFLRQCKARTDGQAPCFPSDTLPAYVAALIFNDRVPELLPATRNPGRPRKQPRRLVDPHLRYAQVDKRRQGGRVVEVRRRMVFGQADDMAVIIHADGCGTEVNTADVERNNLTMRQSVGRLVRKALSFSKNVHFRQRHIDLDDTIDNFVKPHRALRRRVRGGKPKGRKWQQRTPAMAAGLTDHVWSLEELLMFHGKPIPE